MKTFLKATAVTAALAFAPAAMAQDMGWYGDVGVGVLDGDGGFEVTVLQGHAGYNINDNFGIEGELAFGLDDDSGVELDYEAGVYGVLSTANTDGFEFFGRLGFVTAEVSAGSSSADDQFLAYGIGAKYYFDGVNGVRADITSFEGDATTFAIGYARKF